MGALKGHGEPCGNAMHVQTTLLTSLGLIPIINGTKSKFFNKLPYFTTVVIIIGCTVLFAAQLGMVIHAIFITDDPNEPQDFKLKVNSTMQLLTDLTYGLMCLRAIAVLSFLAKHRRAWGTLVKRANNVIQKISMRDSSYPIFSEVWRKTSLLAAVLISVAVLLVECCSWSDEFLYKYDNQSIFATNALAPLPLNFPVWPYILLWTIFVTVPFVVSLQLSACLMIFGQILTDSIRVMTKKLEDLIDIAKFDYDENQVDRSFDDLAVKCAATTKAVEETIVLHLSVVHFSDALNSVFGGLFCAGYCLDVLMLLSYVVGLLAGAVKEADVTDVVENTFGALIFCVFCVVFYTPLIMAYEQGIKFNQTFSRLSNSLLPISRTAAGRSLFTLLQIYADGNTEPLIEFHGAELIHVTRVFVVKTFAFTASLAVVAYRIMSKQRAEQMIADAMAMMDTHLQIHDGHNGTTHH
ncbi:hypothetical protein BV898_17686 [Hypsibius exemplaris]|uniref:Uncharacterized protein n=1 Tax=Hypsibius exemplaris TaxID=2072580 RepID=A0A9X6NFZ1_HYPEX|nr:hypothetical protein BV898_17686 [Hypsibius exemplaris]